jgi:hypothetical protein
LEGVVVFPVDDRDLNGQPCDAASGGEAREAGAHDYHLRLGLVIRRL